MTSQSEATDCLLWQDLSQLVSVTLTHSPHLLGIFKDALNHSDSYTSTFWPIGGLVALASREPLKVL